MKNKGLIATIVVLIAVIITLVAVLVLMQMPTILSTDGLTGKLFGNKETTVIATEETTEIQTISIKETTVELPKLSTTIENYNAYKDHVSIDYPQIKGMEDTSMQEKLNNKIKMNAISIVPLYPISTAVQNLTISCEVKSLDEDYITIIYTGKVLGINSGTSNNSSSGTRSTNRSNQTQHIPDPYLDGFVDPMTIFGQNVAQNYVTPTNPPVANFVNQETETTQVEIIQGSSTNNQRGGSVNANTADKGPVAVDIKSPTAPQTNSRLFSENVASNNPTGNVAPISGFANTNASNIDQQIFYTNTIDMKTGLDVKLGDYISDFSALAKYVRSSKVEFVNIDESDRKAVREYINKTVQSKYIEQMKAADFRNEGITAWPKIFSYKEADGTICFSVKLSSKLGNYAIIKYNK